MHRFVGTLSIIVLLLFVAVLYALKPEPILAAELIFPILTIVFITSSSVVVTYVAVKAYSRERMLSVLFLGCGALVFGCTTLLAALFLGSEGQNFSATVLAMGAVVSGAFHCLCASLTYLGGAPKPGRGRADTLWVPFSSMAVVLIVVAAVGGVLPAFYAAGSGTTMLDRVALGAAAVGFGSSAAVIFAVFSSTRSVVLYWYSLALAATAVGLVGVVVSNGDMSALAMRAGWATMYLGGILLVTSVLSAERLSALSSGKEAKKDL
ncbi:MAG TPA: hypothetical protein VND40_01510 [Nitrososphaerales archaeon]|nr:hypothetical protein [Nitrososphaerales archaeon]